VVLRKETMRTTLSS